MTLAIGHDHAMNADVHMNVNTIESIIELLRKAQRTGSTCADEWQEYQRTIEHLDAYASECYARITGKKDVQKAIKNICACNRKKNSSRPIFGYPFQVDGVTYVTDSYRALKIKRTDGLRIEENPEIKRGATPPDMAHLFREIPRDTCGLPTMAEIEQAIKRAKAQKRTAVYRLITGQVVQAEYLKDSILATGSSVAYSDKERPNAPIHMIDDDMNVHSIVLGIHTKVFGDAIPECGTFGSIPKF